MSLLDHALSVKYSDVKRPVIEEDVIKAIKFKLNNEEGAWKKQSSNIDEESKENIIPQNDNESRISWFKCKGKDFSWISVPFKLEFTITSSLELLHNSLGWAELNYVSTHIETF